MSSTLFRRKKENVEHQRPLETETTVYESDFPHTSPSIRRKCPSRCYKVFLSCFHWLFWSLQCFICLVFLYNLLVILLVSVIGVYMNYASVDVASTLLQRDLKGIITEAKSFVEDGEKSMVNLQKKIQWEYDINVGSSQFLNDFVLQIKRSNFRSVIYAEPTGRAAFATFYCDTDPSKWCVGNYSSHIGPLRFFLLDDENADIEEYNHSLNFSSSFMDIRERSWYQAAVNSSTHVWNIPHFVPTELGHQLAMHLSQSFYHPDDPEFHLGVLALSYNLNELHDQTKSSFGIEETTLFCVGRDGLMLGSSVGIISDEGSSGEDTDGGEAPERIRPDQHESEIIRTIAEGFEEKYGGFVFEGSGDFTYEGNVIMYEFFRDDWGLEMLYVISVPFSSYFGSIYQHIWILVGFGSGAFLFNLFTSIFCCLCFRAVISGYSREIKKIGRLEFDKISEKKLIIRSFGLFDFREINSSLAFTVSGLRNFSKFVPSLLPPYILQQRKKLTPGLFVTNISCMFCDLKDFTSISESVAPNDLVRVLEKFFSLVSFSVVKHEGVVDKYIGDCVMSIFRESDHEVSSVAAALCIVEEVREKDVGFDVQIGINSGSVLMGVTGCQERYTFSAFGDVVNVASRLEGVGGFYDVKILFGEATMEKIRGCYQCRKVDDVLLKGKSKECPIYTTTSTVDDFVLEKKRHQVYVVPEEEEEEKEEHEGEEGGVVVVGEEVVVMEESGETEDFSGSVDEEGTEEESEEEKVQGLREGEEVVLEDLE